MGKIRFSRAKFWNTGPPTSQLQKGKSTATSHLQAQTGRWFAKPGEWTQGTRSVYYDFTSMSFAWKKHMCTSLAAAGPNCSTSIISFNCLVSDAPEKRSTKVSRYLFKNWKKKIIPGGSWASPIDFSIAVNFQASFQCSTNAQTSISGWHVGSLQQWRCDCPLLCARSLYFSTTAANRSYCYAQPFLESVCSQLKSLFPLSSVKE